MRDLPSPRRRVLTAITQQMAKVEASTRTKMTLHGLSIAFGRTLFPGLSSEAVMALVRILCVSGVGVDEAGPATDDASDSSASLATGVKVLADTQAPIPGGDGSGASTAGPALAVRTYSDRHRKQARGVDKTTEYVAVENDVYAQVVVTQNGTTDPTAADPDDPDGRGTGTSPSAVRCSPMSISAAISFFGRRSNAAQRDARTP